MGSDRVWYLRARERNAALAYLIVVSAVPGRKPTQVLTRALAGSPSSWLLTWCGAVTTRACNWFMAWVRALIAERRASITIPISMSAFVESG